MPLDRVFSDPPQYGHFAAPYEWSQEPTDNPDNWPPVPGGFRRIPNSVWGLCEPIRTHQQWREPRYYNDITKIIDNDYRPISPATRLIEAGAGWLYPFQRRILNHVFTPRWDREQEIWRLPYKTFIYSDLKKSGKTALGGGILYGWSRVYGGEMYALANSKDQTKDRAYSRLDMYLTWLLRNNKARYNKEVKSVGGEVMEGLPARTKAMGAEKEIFWRPWWRLTAVPVAPGSQAGGFQSITLWDELWSYEHGAALGLFSEMQPISTIPPVTLPIPPMLGYRLNGKIAPGPSVTVNTPSMRIIVTYAGLFGQSDLLYEAYKATVSPDATGHQPTGRKAWGLEDLPCYVSEDGEHFAYWNQDTPRMAWQTPAFYRSARADISVALSTNDYDRHHRNHWTNAAGAFIDMGQYDACVAVGDAAGQVNRLSWTEAAGSLPRA